MFEEMKEKKNVVVEGFAEEVRLLGNLAFVILRKRDGTLQLIFKKKENPDVFDKLKSVTIESYISAKGLVALNEQARNGFEINVNDLEIISKAEPLPIDVSGKIDSELNSRFNHRFLDLRVKKNFNYFLLRSKLVGYFHEFFQKEGFIFVNTPKITTTGAESGAELFRIDYFGKLAYLAQSPQEYKQMLQASGFEKVYELAPVFRAEKSNTSRHLTEFVGLDVELSNVNNISEVMELEERMFRYIIGRLEKNDAELLKEMNITFNLPKKIPVIKFYDALKLLDTEMNYKLNEDDLDSQSEKLLGKYFMEKHNSDFVFVIDYPVSSKPFYHLRNDDGKTTASFDLLYKGQEITSGSLREHRVEEFIKNANSKGLKIDSMPEYVDMFRYGVPKHGGLGAGLDRIIQKMANVDNVKEVVLFPRDPERLTP